MTDPTDGAPDATESDATESDATESDATEANAPEVHPAGGTSGWTWALRGVLPTGLAVVLLWQVLPRVTGTRWSEIATVVGRLQSWQLALLTAVWAAGLLAYTLVLTSSLPGLTTGQALTVNVAGSGVSNLLPFGGALGFAVTLGMLRSWGFSPGAFVLSALVTGVANVLSKLALPLIGLLALLVGGDVAAGKLAGAATVATAVLAAALGILAGALSSARVAALVGAVAQRIGQTVLRISGSGRRLAWDRAVPRWRQQVTTLVRGAWTKLGLGLVGFLGAQAFLLYVILVMLGSTLNPAQVFAGYAFGRLLSTLVITPGGLGITETGSAGLLVALGGDPAICASGVLLFSGFAFFLEFPAGAAGYLAWVLRRSWRQPPGTDARG